MKKAFLAAALTALVLCACVPAASNTHIMLGPDLSEPDTIELDFTELHNQTIEYFGQIASTPYTFAKDMDISGENGAEKIRVSASLIEGADENDAEHFAAALLRHIGEAAADQYPTLGTGNSDEFGGVFDKFSVSIHMTGADGEEIYSLEVPAGGDIPLDPDIEAYEDEWLAFLTIYAEGQAAQEEAELSETEG